MGTGDDDIRSVRRSKFPHFRERADAPMRKSFRKKLCGLGKNHRVPALSSTRGNLAGQSRGDVLPRKTHLQRDASRSLPKRNGYVTYIHR